MSNLTREELAIAVKDDPYLTKREKSSESDIALYLKEVDFHCPLCGKLLRSRSQKKKNKLFEIAHIYPNSPTPEQFETLAGLRRLGNTCEDYENKIALCKNCHSTQDYHTTKDDYLALLSKKEDLMKITALEEIASQLSLEDSISNVVDKICQLGAEDITDLNYSPLTLSKKFRTSDRSLKVKIAGYVTEYYPFIRSLFRDMEGKNGFRLEVISMQIRCCFIKMADITEDKDVIFQNMVHWLQIKTKCSSTSACEAVISFFVQNCEVFNEVTE